MEHKELKESKREKHHPKPHEKHHEDGKGKKDRRSGVGAAIAGHPDELIKRLLSSPADQSEAIEEVTNNGPEHKQLYCAILLKRTYALVKAIEKQTGSEFTLRKGHLLRSGKPHDSENMPIPFPTNSCAEKDSEKVKEILSHAPAHEQILFNTILQSVEWAIQSLTNMGDGEE